MSAITQKVQAAFSAWLDLLKQTIPEIADCKINPALTAEDFELPSIIVRCEKADELSPGCNVWEAQVMFIINSSPDDDGAAMPSVDGTTHHSIRTRAVYQLLFDVGQNEGDPVSRALALAALNVPVEGPDTRTVKAFTCSCYIFEEETAGWDERHVETSIVICATCSYGDPAS